eukprot:CAMPEP_0184684406 /NCGR_PEP_ID=MMETSP0312-20130426/15181_1 /TAXON_ID=31354 /ORGANISM="Compsopogon coeruleus, Strain SAG 36.94" /LENGTH=925 /DNA_ID=CAMNT_0027137549 /DNA_START=190 /DNA_END=2967 /DNA_ORIENTATION=-
MAGGIRETGPSGDVTLRLNMHYFAEPGSFVAVVGFNENDASLETRMEDIGNGNWFMEVRVRIPVGKDSEMVPYKYVVCWPHKKRYEAIQTRRFMSLQGLKPGDVIVSKDSFRAPNHNVFVTTAFTEAIFGPRGMRKEDSMLGDKALANNWTKRSHGPAEDNDVIAVRFVLLVPRLIFGHTVHITGAGEVLGNYNPEKKIHMLNLGQHLYGAVVYFNRKDFPLEYKYCIYDQKDNLIFRERFDPRKLSLPRDERCRYLNVDEFFVYEREWKGAGVAIPVSALRTINTMGIGDFTSLKLLVDWARLTGLQLIQVLPVNDTGSDPSPYSTNSVFALNPIYVNVNEVAEHAFGVDSVPKDLQEEIEKTTNDLNSLNTIDYGRVLDSKINLLEKIHRVKGANLAKTSEFRSWFATAMEWLAPYACWKSILEEKKEWDHRKWDVTIDQMESLVDERSPYYRRLTFWYFVQYHLHRQLLEASIYANRNGVAFKGDLPIGVVRFGADTWTNPRFFKMDWSAGAPTNGPPPAQNWDFPLYNWEVMKADGYSWWRKRLSHMSEYFQAFRIDHVLGFFRIWAIPAHNYSGVLGHLEPCKPITIEELDSNGLKPYLKRLLLPYITDKVLGDRFGSDRPSVQEHFFTKGSSGLWEFNSDFSTQALVAKAIEANAFPRDIKMSASELRKNLFELIDDRLLLQDETDPSKFYFTCHLHFTTSFKEFPGGREKDRMSTLQDDFFWRRQSWREEGTERLGAIQGAAKMMVCAEDLGHVPPETFEVLDELGILGLRIQRWPSSGNFGDPARYSYLTVASPSCHDCSTVRGWWQEDRWRAHELFRCFFGGNPPHNCDDWVSQKIVESHLNGNSMWAVFPLQDLLDMWDELRSKDPSQDAINRPGATEGVWVYRMPMTLEFLMKKDHFNTFILNLLRRTGRLTPF